MSNVPPREKQTAILSALVEGNSARSIERMTGVHRDTILRLMVRAGNGCANLLNETMRDLPCERLELDELWAFVGEKQRHVLPEEDGTGLGDKWTFVALDAETKLVPSFLVGKRDAQHTDAFAADLASRFRYRVQITTDGLRTYVDAIRGAFDAQGVDYATLVKQYEAEATGPGRYSPPKVTGTEKTPIFGEPITELVSTSYVERQNLMGVRSTRLTNAHSKKLENHVAATALHLGHYSFVRRHSTRTTPAMAAGVTARWWNIDDLFDAAMHAEQS
jgi:IS1 family transposase